MIMTRQSWLKRGISLLLALVMMLSMGYTNAYAAEQTAHEKLEAILTEIDQLNRDDYVPEAYDTLKEQADSVVRPVDANEMPEWVAEYMLNLLTELKSKLVRLDSAQGRLETLLDQIYALNGDDYVSAAYENLKGQADSVVRPVQPYDEATQEGMPDNIAELVINMLQGMVDSLVLKDSAWGRLESVLDEVYALNPEEYSEESYNALKEQADSVVRPVDPAEMPERIADIMAQSLRSMIDSLEPGKTVYEKLESKLQEAEALTATDYTEESWQKVQDIIDALERPVSGDNITEKLAEKMLSDLEVAVNGLEAAPKGDITLENGTYFAQPEITPLEGSVAGYFRDKVKIVAEDGKYRITFYNQISEVWSFDGDYKSNRQYLLYGKNDFRNFLTEALKTGEDEALISSGYAAKNLNKNYDLSSAGFSDEIKSMVQEEYNDRFYTSSYQMLDDGNMSVTIETDSLQELFMNCLIEYDNHKYDSDEINKTWSFSGQMKVEFDINKIEKQAESFDNIDTQVTFNNSVNKSTYNGMVYGFRNNSAHAVSKDGKLYVTYDVNLEGRTKALKNGLSTEILDGDYKPIEVTDGQITLEYDNLDELLCGSRVIFKTLVNDSYRGLVYSYTTYDITPYLQFQPVTLTDEATGIKLLTSTRYVSPDAKLQVEIITDNGSTDEKTDAYANFKSHVSSYNKITFFRFTVTDNGEKVTDFGDSPIMEIPLAEGMNKNTLRLFMNNFINESGIKGFQYGWFNNYAVVKGDTCSIVLDKDYLEGNWGIYDEKLTNTDGSALTDGTYKVPITTFNEAAPDQTSMSAQCIGSEAILVVKDGVKRIELNFSPVAIGDDNGYLIQMWKQNTDGNFEELTYTSYYKNEDGSYYTDEVNEGTTDYYPKTAYMILPSDDAQFITKFRVSAMDAIINGVATRDAIFTIYYDEAVKISDETPDPEPEEVIGGEKADFSRLEALIAKAAEYKEEDYTAYTYTTFVNALEEAKLTASNSKASQEAVDGAESALQKAIDGLQKKPTEEININNLPDGKYTLYAQMIKIDGKTFSMSNNAINHNVWLEVKDGEYYLTMQFKGLSIYNKFGYLMNLSYFDTGYTYNEFGVPQGNLVAAEVLSTYDVIDQYNDANHPYPEMLRIKLVDKAGEKYVPLQVFVPIMEDIADETGTQAVLMQLDWTALKVDDGSVLPEEPEEQSPEVDYTDEATGVKVYAEKGVFEETVQIAVAQISQSSDYDNAAEILNDIGKKFRLFDVKFLDNGVSEVAPNGNVTISFPIAAGYNSAKLEVYRINEDGTRTLVKGTVENGCYTVVTRTAAKYVLVERGSAITDAQNTTNISSGVQTGDASNTTLWLLLMLSSAAMLSALFAAGKRKNIKGE